MMHTEDRILTINAGSSSIKLSLYTREKGLHVDLTARMEHIGGEKARFTINQDRFITEEKLVMSDFLSATVSLIDWLSRQEWFQYVRAIGHRVVHGMNYTKAEIFTEKLLNVLNSISDYDPDHLPAEIGIVRLLREKRPDLTQVACFDTAFHTSIPPVAKTFAIPKKYYAAGIHRYGFHGISYSYLMEELARKKDVDVKGKIILIHLGSGASMAAVKNGKCIDTSMGFTPAGGLVMSTRSGDIDPGVAWYLMREGMDAKAFNDLINHQSGLLGLSGVSADMQTLEKMEAENEDVALAISLFCYQVKKYIGAYTAALGGLDTLVFSGGIGENAPGIRQRICNELQFAGIGIDQDKNAKNENLISETDSRVAVFVIPTNEELMMARMVNNILENQNS